MTDSMHSMPDSATVDTARLSRGVPILLLASACWDVPTPVNVHHIAQRFAAAGHQVLFVESTGLRRPSVRSMQDRSRIVRRLGGWWRGARQVEENLAVLSPLALPAHWPQPARALSGRWLGAAVRHSMRQLNMKSPVLWAFLPTYHRILDRVPHRLLVYHCVDDYAANPGVDAEAVRADERRILRRAHLVFASSRPLAERLKRQRSDVHLLPNVADVERFAPAVERHLPEPHDLTAIPRPRAVYIGNLAGYRFDRNLLAQTADRLPSVQFVLIGPLGVGDLESAAETWQALQELANVHLLDARPHEELPAYLAHCDVGVIPFLDNEHTRSSFPLKLWEMLGAGLPVVATDLPAMRDAAPSNMVRIATTESFAEAVEQSLAPASNGREKRLAIARQHDWAKRTQELRELIGAALSVRTTC